MILVPMRRVKRQSSGIKAALEAAHKEKAMVFLDGTYYISNQIVMDKTVSGARGLFGSGMGKTKVTFDKAQTGVFNPDTNHDDIREFAGILVDGQNNKTIADLSVQYTNPDFYRKGLSYFGKVNGILVKRCGQYFNQQSRGFRCQSCWCDVYVNRFFGNGKRSKTDL